MEEEVLKALRGSEEDDDPKDRLRVASARGPLGGAESPGRTVDSVDCRLPAPQGAPKA